MGDRLVDSAVTVAVAIVGLATVAVLVSSKANTAGVIGSGTKGLAADISAAVSPVTGGGMGFTGFNSSEFTY